MSEQTQGASDNRKELRRLKRLVDQWLIQAIIGGGGITLIYGLVAGISPGAFRMLASGASSAKVPLSDTYSHALGMLLAPCIAGGALALGVMAGFLFGLPRSLTSGEVREIARTSSEAADTAAQSSGRTDQGTASSVVGYGANTNLERISDWLTTIIVGLGLTRLPQLLHSIEVFGERVDGLFGFGGRAFGIGGGLYFLVFGFLLSYISTRTKLLLIFTGNDRENNIWASSPFEIAVKEASTNSVIPASAPPAPAASGPPVNPLPPPSQADQIVIANLSMQAKQTPEEMLALANASARGGEYSKSKVLYDEYLKIAPQPSNEVILNYASVLGLNGDRDSFASLKKQINETIKTDNAAAAEQKFVEGMRAALQANLYNGRYEDSVRIGEMLIEREGLASDAWIHVWLACGYGQKHAELAHHAVPDPVLVERAAQRAIDEVGKAIDLDPTMREYISTLYDPAKINKIFRNPDNDLQSLYGDPRMEALLAVPEAPTPEPATPAELGTETPGGVVQKPIE